MPDLLLDREVKLVSSISVGLRYAVRGALVEMIERSVHGLGARCGGVVK